MLYTLIDTVCYKIHLPAYVLIERISEVFFRKIGNCYFSEHTLDRIKLYKRLNEEMFSASYSGYPWADITFPGSCKVVKVWIIGFEIYLFRTYFGNSLGLQCPPTHVAPGAPWVNTCPFSHSYIICLLFTTWRKNVKAISLWSYPQNTRSWVPISDQTCSYLFRAMEPWTPIGPEHCSQNARTY